MKKDRFSVYFVGAGEEVVEAITRKEAIILAAAERIKKGEHFDAYCVHNRTTDEKTALISRKAISIGWGHE